MKRLEVNPQNHEIVAMADEIYKGDYADVSLKIGSDRPFIHHAFTEKEAAQLGKWFLELSTKLKVVKRKRKAK